MHHQSAPLSTSLLATAGGVVFSGDLDPALKAFDDATGKLLWQARLDDLPSSSVVTYSIGKTQYVAVVVGLRNNHVSDLSRTYTAFRKNRGGLTSIRPTAAPRSGSSRCSASLDYASCASRIGNRRAGSMHRHVGRFVQCPCVRKPRGGQGRRIRARKC